jgi:cell division protein FtsI/penicillin-binding protein 2
VPTPRTCSATSGPVSDADLARQDEQQRAAAARPGGAAVRGAAPAGPASAGPLLRRTDTIGRAGLEKQYDRELRGAPGVTKLAVDHMGGVTGTVEETDAVPGNHLVTSIDATVQAVAERELRAAISRARTVGDRNKKGRKYKADSGAVVVMDVRTGRLVAMASYPTYDPKVWVGGISAKEYASLSASATTTRTSHARRRASSRPARPSR